ncbi:hypothetical protein [Reinekea marinisedimentorum]|uniref:Concanavalin A-like lectin/glucanase superfamily protein n=1 Tax=Reinekea marinisedimentorum TaxID=230495 RepID=A0A4R3IFV4_9GAMM|nr:hypothetical protein [Reinekea marinisedimentorum]TCS43872.1 hypothetical protein BCF53_101215 [Reinekea marinisedimentorum]
MSVKSFLVSIFTCSILLSANNLQARTFELEGFAVGSQIDTVETSFETFYLDGETLIGEISNDVAYSGRNSLKVADYSTEDKPYVRVPFAGGQHPSGLVKARVYIPEGNLKSTYINLGVGKNNSDRYFELKISGSGDVQYESGSFDPSIGSVSINEWHLVEIYWANDMVTVAVDRKIIADDIPVLNTAFSPSGVTIYTGDKSGAGNVAYFDDIMSNLF